MQKPNSEGCRSDVKKTYEDEQYPLDVDEHQMPDHRNTFMKLVTPRSQDISAANDERRQVLQLRVIWD
jgi:hypothetical protein